MDSLTLLKILVGVVATIFIHHLWTLPQKRKQKQEAPQAPGSWPILGHLPLLANSALPHRTLSDLADRYGSAITLRLGSRPTLIVSDSDLAKECLATNDRILATRPDNPASTHLAYNRAMLGFAPYGPHWRESRKIATLELLSHRRLELLKHVRVSEVDLCVHELYGRWAENKGEKATVEMKQRLEDLTFNVVTRMVSGKRYYGTGTVTGAEEGEARRFQRLIEELFRLAAVFDITDAIPFLRWVGIGGYKGEMERVARELGEMFESWVEDRRHEKSNGHDFLDVLMETVKEGNFPTAHTPNTIIKGITMNIIMAGTDTSAATMTWALAALVNNRRVLEKVQAELDLHVGRDRIVEEADIKHLTYLNAVIKETMRLYPAGPLLVPHEAMENCTIGGFKVRAGTRLLVNAWKIHRDPSAWEDAEEFKPERFLTTKAHVDVYGKHFEYIPFGAGRRSCPGVSLALHVMHLTLARLLQAFEWDTLTGEKLDMSENFGLTLRKDGPLEVTLKPRLPVELYH
ncbi:hypothetical protein AMTRI_Chr13g124930 [Amborella trichopoda]